MNTNRVKRDGARIDLNKPLEFSFDGRGYRGYQGDSLASALLANDVKMIGRSFKYGRPRGIMGTGPEEPNALVQLETGAYTIPDPKAGQVELYEGLIATSTTGWPSLGFDLKSILGRFNTFMPPGFYYKTFMKPAKLWPFYEGFIRQAAGYGKSPVDPDPEFYDHLHHHVDILVIGGGLSGILSALISARAGLRTMLIDEQSEMGGWLLTDRRSVIDGKPALEWAHEVIAELDANPNVIRLARTSAFALHDLNLIQAVEQIKDHIPISQRDVNQPRQRLHKIRAHQVVLATGAIERPLVYGYNDVPGAMTASSAQTFLNRYSVRVGHQVVLMTTNDCAYDAALDLSAAGAQVTLLDTRATGPARHLKDAAVNAGIELMLGYGIAKTEGRRSVNGVQLVKLDTHSNKVLEKGPRIGCDSVLSSGGLTPTVHLFCHNGSRPVWSDERLSFVVPQTGRGGISCVGAITGNFSLAESIEQTFAAMAEIFSAAGKTIQLEKPVVDSPSIAKARRLFRVPDGKPEGLGAKAFVDFQNDVASADIHLAVRENYRSIEHVKRYTALGFGTDQGKLSNVNGFAIAAEALGLPIQSVGTTTYRPAYSPVSFGVLAGPTKGDTWEPKRYTAMQSSHTSRGAEFEVVGQWMRPWYFPKGNEDLHAAVNRECVATRNSVGIMDASTLGKIDVRGPDAREFLNRVYSNAWTQLAPGKCRYGLMLDENGMVMDDGVTACITDNHFHMTTTSGGAARVMTWLERWLQTEWPDLKVYLTSTTDHWATAAAVGPNSRAVLQRLCNDIDFSPENFKFMDWREGTVAGLPARVFRISFSGELAYEINVDASYGHYLWESVMAAGKEFDITPYGTETMHVLRAEKGFIIVGQDTDGSVSPIDLGMGWAVGMKKPFSFLGKRSLSRSDTARIDRKQLVGLTPEDPNVVIAEGAQILEFPEIELPVAMLGHVTSSYHSAFLGRSIAMAVVKSGATRTNQTLYAYAQGKVYPVKVVSPVFVDPKGDRQNA